MFPIPGFHDFTSLYSNNVGLGLRYSTPVGPIRFDLGQNLQSGTGESKRRRFSSALAKHFRGRCPNEQISRIPPDSGNREVSNFRGRRHRFAAIAAWVAAIVSLTALVALVAVTALFNSTRFHEYVLRNVEAKASESLGTRVELQNFTLHLSTLSVDLYGVTVDGATPYSNTPLLQVAHAQAGLRIVSILRRTWYLLTTSSSIAPWCKSLVDKSNGRSQSSHVEIER